MNARFHDLLVGRWQARFMGKNFCLSIGRGGLATKAGEGDGATPIGVWKATDCLYRSDRLLPPVCILKPGIIGMMMGWSDDPMDKNYNKPIRLPYGFSHEKLYRADNLYTLILTTDYNCAAKRNKGSAIFVHCWRKPRYPTSGCIAFSLKDLCWIVAHWRQDSRILVSGR